MTEQALNVELGPRSYRVHSGEGLLGRLEDYVPAHLRGRPAFILTDENVAASYLPLVKKAWGGPCADLILPPGEATKSFDHLAFVLSWLFAHNVDKSGVIIALGGGMIGDLAGLTAALALRGLPLVQIPTTLLAQVDSAVGGKTAVNMPHAKNMIGTFYQPAVVIADTDTLRTLPAREMRAGYAEIVKYGLIRDAAFFEWLEDHGQDVLARQGAAVAHAVKTSCAMKAAVVAEDERDEGARLLLNFGHTFGHAIEAVHDYDGTVLHGEAVAMGMVLAFRYAVRRGLCPADDAARVERHLAAAGLPVGLSSLCPPDKRDAMMAAMMRDKKARGGRVRFILTRGIGKAFVAHDVDIKDVAAFINEETGKDS